MSGWWLVKSSCSKPRHLDYIEGDVHYAVAIPRSMLVIDLVEMLGDMYLSRTHSHTVSFRIMGGAGAGSRRCLQNSEANPRPKVLPPASPSAFSFLTRTACIFKLWPTQHVSCHCLCTYSATQGKCVLLFTYFSICSFIDHAPFVLNYMSWFFILNFITHFIQKIIQNITFLL